MVRKWKRTLEDNLVSLANRRALMIETGSPHGKPVDFFCYGIWCGNCPFVGVSFLGIMGCCDCGDSRANVSINDLWDSLRNGGTGLTSVDTELFIMTMQIFLIKEAMKNREDDHSKV